MTVIDKPKALRLADLIDANLAGAGDFEIAAELRRLHAEVEALRDWVREHGSQTDTCTWYILREKCTYCQCHRSKT